MHLHRWSSVQSLVLKLFFGFTRIDVRSLSWLWLVIVRSLLSRCNHSDRSGCLISIKSVVMLASDPLQHFVIESCRPFVCNILFRSGQKNGWAKIWDPKKWGIPIFCSHIFLPKQDRSRLPLHNRAVMTGRPTLLSSAFATICDLRTCNYPRMGSRRKTDCQVICSKVNGF